MKINVEIKDEAGNVQQCAVMRSSSEIQSRIDEINATIKQMTQERWKSVDKGYIDHLCNEISNLQGQRDSLVWVRNYA